MILLIILILIVAVALPSINQNISKNLYVGISSIIFICAVALAFYAFYIQSIGSGIGIYSGFFQVTAIISNNLFSLSSTQLIILKKIILFLTWFVIGVYSYLNLLSPNLKNKINNLTFFECLVISFTFILILNLLVLLLEYYLFSSQLPDVSLYSFITDNNSNVNSSNGVSFIDRAGDAAIMGTALTIAGKIAQQTPNGAAKAAVLAGGTVISASAIALKNITGNATSNIGRNNYIENIMQIYNNTIYTFTGNDAIDLLNIIQILNKTNLLLFFLIFYNFIVQYINVNRLESFLVKYLPLKPVSFYIKSLKLLQKTSSVLIKVLFILLLISNLLSYYYLGFFIDNLDKIIEFYFKK